MDKKRIYVNYNSYRSPWWKFWLARIFGRHIITIEGKHQIYSYYFRGVFYVVKDELVDPVKRGEERANKKVATESATQPEIEFCQNCGTALGCLDSDAFNTEGEE